MASGLVAGCWVFLADTMPFAKYTNREKSKGRSLRARPGCPSSLPYPVRYVLVTPARIFKLQPFRNVKGDFCRTPSIGFNGHRYSNLFDGGSSSFNPFLPVLLLYSYLLFLSLSFSSRFFPAMKTVTRNRCELSGVGKGTGKKEFAFRSFLFSPSAVDTRGLDLERKLRRQMRASARGNCSSLIFRAAFPSEDLDLEKRDGVALQGPSM